MRGLDILVWLCFFVHGILCDFVPEINSVIEEGENLDIVSFDDSPVLLKRTNNKLERSEDNGFSWKNVDVKNIADSWRLEIDFNRRTNTAFFFGSEKGFFRTNDRGLSWDFIDLGMDEHNILLNAFVFSHPTKEKIFIVTAISGEEVTEDNKSAEGTALGFSSLKIDSYISTDGKTLTKFEIPVVNDKEAFDIFSTECRFVRQTTNSNLWDDDDIICEVSGSKKSFELNSPYEKRIFKGKIGSSKFEQLDGFQGANIETVVILENFLVVITSEDKFDEATTPFLWVCSEETKGHFIKSHLPTRFRSKYAQIFEYNHRIVVSVVFYDETNDENESIRHANSLILLSNTHGENFRILELDHNDSVGFVKLNPLPFLNNTMIASLYSSSLADGILAKTSKITFDGGKNWQKLQVLDPEKRWEFPCDISDVENCSLFAPTTLYQSSYDLTPNSFTPGIQAVVGGVKGKDDKTFSHLSTFVSRDSGKTWKKVIDSASMFAFGDYGNIIVAVPIKFANSHDNKPLTTLHFSLDQGETFNVYNFERPFEVTNIFSNTFDGSGNIFTIIGLHIDEKGNMQRVLHIVDFSKAFDGTTCVDSDMESWFLSEGECVNGARLMFKRRKQNASCLVKRNYKDLTREEQPCECTQSDYECSPGFLLGEDGNCLPDYSAMELSSACGEDNSPKMSPKQIQKNTKCQRALKIHPIQLDCNMVQKMDESVRVVRNQFEFTFKSYQYFDTFEEEVILMRSSQNDVYVSYDEGENMQKLNADGENILEINFNPYFNNFAYLFGATGILYTTSDRGRTFKANYLPQARELGFPLSFSANVSDTFIYYGGENCDNLFDRRCHSVAFLTRDGGVTFMKMLEGALKCDFVGSTLKNSYNPDLVVCEVKDKETGKKSFVSSVDYFTSKSVLYEDIVGFMSTGDYVVIAKRQDGELRMYLTVDGSEYAEAILPQDLNSYEQKEFTVLGSRWGAIFMHMTTSVDQHEEFGALMKSNSNGTSFVILERAVNRNGRGFVDFESLEDLEGIIFINTVLNSQEIMKNKDTVQKQIKSKITFNDGADWTYIKPPKLDSEGKKYTCNTNDLQKCSLNLHGFTERRDVRDTFSSGSASGYMIATGNVGEYLLPIEEASTFMTDDGGATWKELAKGPYQWEYGDHGSVIVLVKDGENTNTIKYSVDGGKQWNDYEFTSESLYITDIVTVPKDSALRFLLFGSKSSVEGSTTVTFTLDFRNAFQRQCDPPNLLTDFSYFPLRHPNQEECLFGHQAEFLRKTADDCFIGMAPIDSKFRITKNCSCTRNDFECDYNFVRMADGTCKLADGVSPADPLDICRKDNSLIEYFEPTGYRKIPLSTCKGGLHLEAAENPKPCPGKESEFNDLHNLNTPFMLIWFIIFAILLGALSFVYHRGIRRNGGFARFGEIRLGDDDLIEENGTDRAVNKIVRGGVYAASALFSAFHLLNREINNIFKRIKSRFVGNMGPTYQSLLHDQFLDDADDLLTGHDEDADDLESFMENDANFEIDNDEENERNYDLDPETEALSHSNIEENTSIQEQDK